MTMLKIHDGEVQIDGDAVVQLLRKGVIWRDKEGAGYELNAEHDIEAAEFLLFAQAIREAAIGEVAPDADDWNTAPTVGLVDSLFAELRDEIRSDRPMDDDESKEFYLRHGLRLGHILLRSLVSIASSQAASVQASKRAAAS